MDALDASNPPPPTTSNSYAPPKKLVNSISAAPYVELTCVADCSAILRRIIGRSSLSDGTSYPAACGSSNDLILAIKSRVEKGLVM